MKRFKCVAIAGTGLIGGSLGLAVRRRRLASKVVGISRSAGAVRRALEIGAIDAGSCDIGSIAGCDLLILCLPVNQIIRQARDIARLVAAECLVCDVGSTKSDIVSSLERIFPRFVGCHPMAGSEKRGIANADKNLFDGSLCILTRTPRTDATALAEAAAFWKSVCGRIAVMSPRRHDRIMASVSHLPHALSFSLMRSVPTGALPFSAGSLRDTTRLAGSDAGLWSDIFLSNRKNLAGAIRRFESELLRMRKALEKGDRRSVAAFMALAASKRAVLEKQR